MDMTYGWPKTVSKRKAFQEKMREIDAIICYEMPGMNGIELAAELKRHNATLPVIMISGCVPLEGSTGHTVDALFPKALRSRKFWPESNSCCA